MPPSTYNAVILPLTLANALLIISMNGLTNRRPADNVFNNMKEIIFS